MPAEALYLGLISGTSVDAIDAALVRFDGHPELLARLSFPYPEALRQELLAVGLGDGRLGLAELGALDVQVGEQFARAALALLEASGHQPAAVRAIGSHGQTLWHAPRGLHPCTLQIGDPNVIAERTGIDTVADFRRRDLAAGGEGAPLAPGFHAAFLADPEEARAVLNLGGIANLSLLVPGRLVLGFDSGPANSLLDAWSHRQLGERQDRGGALAAAGQVDQQLLARCLGEPYFALPAPKSTGRDLFNLAWLDRHLQGLSLPAADVQATLVALTAQSVARALIREVNGPLRVLACGGGVHNPVLMAALAAELAPAPVQSTAEFGVDPDFVEAMAFGWLAREHIEGRSGNLPAVTGARGPRPLGGIYRA